MSSVKLFVIFCNYLCITVPCYTLFRAIHALPGRKRAGIFRPPLRFLNNYHSCGRFRPKPFKLCNQHSLCNPADAPTKRQAKALQRFATACKGCRKSGENFKQEAECKIGQAFHSELHQFAPFAPPWRKERMWQETHIERHLESSPSELATSSAENITNCTNNVEWENSAKIHKAEAQQAFDQVESCR